MDELQLQFKRITDSIATACANKYTSAAMQAANTANVFSSLGEKGVQAGILNNFRTQVVEKIYDSVDTAATRGQSVNMMNDFGPYIPEVWPIVIAWYPDFPLRDLISVQDMKQDLAYLLFSTLTTGTNKSPTVVGQTVETPLGMRQIDGRYPGGEIIGENITNAQLEYDSSSKMLIAALAYYALDVTGDEIDKIKIVVSGTNVTSFNGTYTPLSVSLGRVILQKDNSGADSGSYIDIANGGVYIYAADSSAKGTDTAMVANYVWDIDYAVQENIQKVKEQVIKVEMRAKPRVISMHWTIFAEALKKSQFQKDIREENTKRVLDLLYQYQVRYILDTMWTYAQGTPSTVTVDASASFSLDVQAASLARQLRQLAAQIELTTGRIEGNRLVVGLDLKSFLVSLPTTWFKPTNVDFSFSSPREIGEFAGFKVYYDPMRASNENFMTYRGEQWYDAAFYMGVFLPLVPTDTVVLNITAHQAFAEMVAYRFDKPQAVIPFTFSVTAGTVQP